MANEHNKILIAEDEKSIAHAYGEYLGRRGYLMEYAYDGEEALVKTKSFEPDLILLDIVMPKLDGISVLKKLKEDKDMDNIPVIVLTNLESAKSAEEAFEAGTSQYLVKTNYSLDDIVDKVKETLKETYHGM
ncbi:response regulator [Candidatus Azambacteria bacterium]|nr:response regulator [Candidatus Azambacteria bacterium]